MTRTETREQTAPRGGRVIRDLAVMLADGEECVAYLGAVRDQQALFGPVATRSGWSIGSLPILACWRRCGRRTQSRANSSGDATAHRSG